MSTQSLCFPDVAPYVVDTCLACPTVSEVAWGLRYNCPGPSCGQSGGKRGRNKRPEVTKEFMLRLLKPVVANKDDNREQRIRKCSNQLKSLVSLSDFVYNKTKGEEGLDLICRHMADLRDAFPKMDLSVTHFRDFEKHSSVSILVAQGIMKGPWLNRPASGEYEYLAVVFHLLPNKEKSKVNEVHFRSEFLSEETYRKLRALDLLHTAFAVNASAKEIIKENVEKVAKNNRNRNIAPSALPVVGVPLLLAASVAENRENRNNARFQRELAEAERNIKNQDKELNANVNLIENNQALINDNNEDSETDQDEEDDNEGNKAIKIELETENNNNNNEPENNAYYRANENDDDDDDDGENGENGENGEDENLNVEGKKTENLVMNPLVRAELERAGLDPNKGAQQNTELLLNAKNRLEQSGGDGYYAAVEQIPVGGQPVYQGYSSCCPPYFTTDGSQWDAMCSGMQGGRAVGQEIAFGSKTLSMMKDGVVYSMTASVLDSAGNDTADAMGMTGPMKRRVKNHLSKHMHDHARAIVRKNVDQGVEKLSDAIPHSKNMRLIVVPQTAGARKAKKGGNLLGTLGTILFPAGTAVDNVVPWLLTIGALMGKRIETDLYDITGSASKSRKRKGTRKGMVRKTARRAYEGLGKKKRRRAPAKSRKRSASKTRKRTASKTRKRTTSKSKTRKRSTSKGRKRKAPKRKPQKKKSLPRRGRRWQPLTNSDIRRIMSQRGGMKGGFCGAGICGDAVLSPFDGCRRPEWGPRNWVKPNVKDPICI